MIPQSDITIITTEASLPRTAWGVIQPPGHPLTTLVEAVRRDAVGFDQLEKSMRMLGVSAEDFNAHASLLRAEVGK